MLDLAPAQYYGMGLQLQKPVTEGGFQIDPGAQMAVRGLALVQDEEAQHLEVR